MNNDTQKQSDSESQAFLLGTQAKRMSKKAKLKMFISFLICVASCAAVTITMSERIMIIYIALLSLLSYAIIFHIFRDEENSNYESGLLFSFISALWLGVLFYFLYVHADFKDSEAMRRETGLSPVILLPGTTIMFAIIFNGILAGLGAILRKIFTKK